MRVIQLMQTDWKQLPTAVRHNQTMTTVIPNSSYVTTDGSRPSTSGDYVTLGDGIIVFYGGSNETSDYLEVTSCAAESGITTTSGSMVITSGSGGTASGSKPSTSNSKPSTSGIKQSKPGSKPPTSGKEASNSRHDKILASNTKTASKPRTKASIHVPLTINALISCLVASLGCVAAGTVVAYTSPAVHSMNTGNNSPFRVSADGETWVGSAFALGEIIGVIAISPIIDCHGRKLGMMITALPFVLGWLTVVCSSNLATLCVGRTLTGFSRGLTIGVVHVYVAEISPPDKRGMLLGVGSVGIVLGNLYEYILGYFLPWDWLAIASAVIPVVMLILVCLFIPESPRWLLMTGRRQEAEDVLDWLRESSRCVDSEILEMEKGASDGRGFTFKENLKPQFLYPLLITMAIFTLQQFCGNTVLRVYAVNIFLAGNTTIDPEVQCIIMGLLAVAGTLSATVLLDHLGRRTMLVISCAGMAICMAAAGAYFKIRDTNPDYAETYLSWLPTVSLVLNNLSYSLAFDPVPWMMASELFTTRERGRANSICGVWQSICAFLACKFADAIYRGLNTYGVFWLSGSICALGVVFVFCMLPETKMVALESIERKFDKSP